MFLKKILKKIYFYLKFQAKVATNASISSKINLSNGVKIKKQVIILGEAKIDEFATINSRTFINGKVHIGENCWIGEDVIINSKLFSLGRFSIIGSNTSFNNKLLSTIKIGKFSQVASGTEFWNATHRINNITTYPLCEKIHIGKSPEGDFENCGDIILGNDVWIGRNVTITTGVTIGDGAVVGANAVVTKDIPSYAIVGGIPARILRYRFEETKIKQLLELQWWDWSIEKIKSEIDFLCPALNKKLNP